MSILGRAGRRKPPKDRFREARETVALREGKFVETLKSMGYSTIPVLLTTADVKALLGRIPTTLENMTACGEKGFYRARDVETLWWKL